MAKRKKENFNNVVSLHSFGLAKNYWICWVKNNLAHFAFANALSKNIDNRCSFIADISFDAFGESLLFPTYFLSFSEEYSVDVAIVCNKTTLSDSTSSKLQNPLLGGLLFEDEYYIFNTAGLMQQHSSFADADYIMLLSADKSVAIDEYTEIICGLTGMDLKILEKGTPEDVSERQVDRKKFLDFLQFLFYETENSIKEYRMRKLFKKLHNKMSVAEKNYGKLKYPIDDYRVLTSPFLRRDDI